MYQEERAFVRTMDICHLGSEIERGLRDVKSLTEQLKAVEEDILVLKDEVFSRRSHLDEADIDAQRVLSLAGSLIEIELDRATYQAAMMEALELAIAAKPDEEAKFRPFLISLAHQVMTDEFGSGKEQ